MAENCPQYTADMIEVLTASVAIRRRPAMYVGPLDDPLAATRLLQESLCLALDAACCGTCTRIDVTLHHDGSATVADNGPGQSLKPSADGRAEAELLMTELFACRDRKADERVGEASCGVGVAVMNALSEWCVLTTSYENGRWRQRYRQGVPQGPFERVDDGDSHVTGTVLSFKPDASILGRTGFDAGHFAAWVRGLDLPPSPALVRLADERSGNHEVIRWGADGL